MSKPINEPQTPKFNLDEWCKRVNDAEENQKRLMSGLIDLELYGGNSPEMQDLRQKLSETIKTLSEELDTLFQLLRQAQEKS
ncbi:MAG TPA: hypothetical protein VGT24_13225 [Candidatus Acidoferrales bacterium]|nr:hypothetical protein [Candidatus Acidoferrales bacterium]